MAVNVPVRQMPLDVHLVELYRGDVLLNLFVNRIPDEYFEEVGKSDWSIAPEASNELESVLSDDPTMPEGDDVGGEKSLRVDWSPKQEEIAEAVEKEFGVNGDDFTIQDVVDLKSSFKENTVRQYFNEVYKENEFARQTGENRGKSKVWRWTKTIYENEVSDGGIPHDFSDYNWTLPKTIDTGLVLKDGQRGDWYSTPNLDDFLEIFVDAEKVHQHIQILRTKRRDIDDGLTLDEWDTNELRESLKRLRTHLQSIFSTFREHLSTAFDCIDACADSSYSDADAGSVEEGKRPHKMKNSRIRQLKGRWWGLNNTYIKPLLLHFPVDATAFDPDKQEQLSGYLQDLEDVGHAFLRWLWVCYLDLRDREYQEADNVPDVIVGYLREFLYNDGSDAISFTRLMDRLSTGQGVDLTEDELLEILQDLCGNEQEYTIRVWLEDEEPESVRPRDAPMYEELEVEISYDEDYHPDHIEDLRLYAGHDPRHA